VIVGKVKLGKLATTKGARRRRRESDTYYYFVPITFNGRRYNTCCVIIPLGTLAAFGD
jgi:hypothetical protein